MDGKIRKRRRGRIGSIILIWHITAYVYFRFREDVFGKFIHIPFIVHDFGYSGVYEYLGAQATRERRGVENGPFHAGSMVRGLSYGVLLGVDPATELVARPRRHVELLAEATGVLAVGDALGCTVVTG